MLRRFDPIIYILQVLSFVAFLGGLGGDPLGRLAGLARQARLEGEGLEPRSGVRRTDPALGRLRFNLLSFGANY